MPVLKEVRRGATEVIRVACVPVLSRRGEAGARRGEAGARRGASEERTGATRRGRALLERSAATEARRAEERERRQGEARRLRAGATSTRVATWCAVSRSALDSRGDLVCRLSSVSCSLARLNRAC